MARIVIDMQGAQSASRHRGIGRYFLALAKAIARQRGAHEIVLALNGMFLETVAPIRTAFDGMLPPENIRVWDAVAPIAAIDRSNSWRAQAAELVYETFLHSLEPDIILAGSLFEGLGDDAATAISEWPSGPKVATILYDLIPLIYPDRYLKEPERQIWYQKKIEQLRRADLWLAISESSRREGIEHLSLPEDRIVNISADADACYRQVDVPTAQRETLRRKYRLTRPFVMSSCAVEPRKNMEGLIRAFARLPRDLRAHYQLVIVCPLNNGLPQDPTNQELNRLKDLIEESGFTNGDIILTGFVPDEDLIALYNTCTLFVFPSLHEGFGLPALEAMRCGAPVIGSNTTSLPEVIGWNEALFDPHSEASMAESIRRGLTDQAFRESLVRNALAHSKKFSWDESARRVLSSIETLPLRERAPAKPGRSVSERPRLAYVSPLPPERTGIADYSAELLPELAGYYDIEIITGTKNPDGSLYQDRFPLRDASWFLEHHDNYNRVLYQFGNSPFHEHMFALLALIPGVIVLHDFYLSDVLAYMQRVSRTAFFDRILYDSHGYEALQFFLKNSPEETIGKYPCNLEVINNSTGIISHSNYSRELAEIWTGGSPDWSVIPLLRIQKPTPDRSAAKTALGFRESDFVVCSFGMLARAKLNHRLLQAWLKSRLSRERSCHLVFVGEPPGNDYGRDLAHAISAAGANGSIRITGWTSKEQFEQYLAAADIGVQLRTRSRGETSAAVLDCMNYGLATIVNANGSMAELDDDALLKLPDAFDDADLVSALEKLWQDSQLRASLGQRAREVIADKHNPSVCAAQYHDAIEAFHEKALRRLPGLIGALRALPGTPDARDLNALASSLAKTFPARCRQKQILVDISALVEHDLKTGIQRVIRSVLEQWLKNPPDGFRVEPVYASPTQTYRYARRFTAAFLGMKESSLCDEAIDYAAGDFFFGLDWNIAVAQAHKAFYQELRVHNVRVKFLVHDILPISMPQYFPDGMQQHFTSWLKIVAESDGAICVSQTVANELERWLQSQTRRERHPFRIDWSHNGADIEHSAPTRGMPNDAQAVLDRIKRYPTFLMVGTIEPRKGHTQVLDAFAELWRQEQKINLVIVGKIGWQKNLLVDRMRELSDENEHMMWLDGISDEYLQRVYDNSTCLIAASYGEGFGLPLIEAAMHNLPVLARNIPVFREVASDHACYFEADDATGLAKAILLWLSAHTDGKTPSAKIPYLTWKQSAERLMQLCLDEQKSTSDGLRGQSSTS